MIAKIKRIISSLIIDPVMQDPRTTNLSGQVIVITGGTRGLGQAIARIALRQGASVAVISRSGADLTVPEGYDSARFISIAANVADAAGVESAVAAVLQRFGRIDVLIDNAGQFQYSPIDEATESDYDRVMDTNLKGVFLFTKEVVPVMKKQKSGYIINIGSKISRNTNVEANKVLYATSKYAVEGFSFALHKELKPFGIRVSCLMPGTLNTFVSLKSKSFLAPADLAYLIIAMIQFKIIDFESMVVKSVHQNI